MRLSSFTTSSGILMVMLVMGRSLRRRARRSLLFIIPSFVDRDCTRGDEADKRWAENIDDLQQFPVAGHPDYDFTLFPANNFCPDEVYKGVEEDLACCFEYNAVFAEV
jgi:hypothetical protein